MIGIPIALHHKAVVNTHAVKAKRQRWNGPHTDDGIAILNSSGLDHPDILIQKLVRVGARRPKVQQSQLQVKVRLVNTEYGAKLR